MKPLKVICLNTWGAMIGIEKLIAFFENHQDIDVFCLQEVYNGDKDTPVPKIAAGRDVGMADPEFYTRLKTILPNHSSYFTVQYLTFYGMVIFYRKDFRAIDQGAISIYREPGYVSSIDIADHGRLMHYVTIETERGPLTILNLHAAWQPGGKIDTPGRLDQSQKIIDFTKKINHPMILCGDFNLLPNTQSIKMIEEAGWENLIRTYGITSTRTSVYQKAERYADYVFVKNGIEVQDFRVLPEEVSDHAALLLECS